MVDSCIYRIVIDISGIAPVKDAVFVVEINCCKFYAFHLNIICFQFQCACQCCYNIFINLRFIISRAYHNYTLSNSLSC